jgi:hypothetical protein
LVGAFGGVVFEGVVFGGVVFGGVTFGVFLPGAALQRPPIKHRALRGHGIGSHRCPSGQSTLSPERGRAKQCARHRAFFGQSAARSWISPFLQREALRGFFEGESLTFGTLACDAVGFGAAAIEGFEAVDTPNPPNMSAAAAQPRCRNMRIFSIRARRRQISLPTCTDVAASQNIHSDAAMRHGAIPIINSIG